MTKEELFDMMELLNKIEIKGETNIFYMFNVMKFINSKIKQLEEQEKEGK